MNIQNLPFSVYYHWRCWPLLLLLLTAPGLGITCPLVTRVCIFFASLSHPVGRLVELYVDYLWMLTSADVYTDDS